jgi:hypothetical protein
MELSFNLKSVEINEEKLQEFIEKDLCGSEFLIVDEEGRAAALLEHVKETLWAFNSSFIMNHLKTEIKDNLSDYEYDQLEKSIQHIQEKLCEGANTIIKALISDVEELASDAAAHDGHGPYLSNYDGNEIEYTDENGNELYIYRLN